METSFGHQDVRRIFATNYFPDLNQLRAAGGKVTDKKTEPIVSRTLELPYTRRKIVTFVVVRRFVTIANSNRTVFARLTCRSKTFRCTQRRRRRRRRQQRLRSVDKNRRFSASYTDKIRARSLRGIRFPETRFENTTHVWPTSFISFVELLYTSARIQRKRGDSI